MIQGLFVDFYGTLVHEDDIPISRITAKIQLHSRPGTTRQDIGAFWYHAFTNTCNEAINDRFVTQERLAITTLSATLDAFGADLDVHDLIASQLEHWNAPPLFPDSRRFLDAARSLRLPIFILSNIDRSHIAAAMQLHNLSFNGVITSEDVCAYKPNPAMFHAALRQSGLSPDEVLHIGDSRMNDIEGAHAAGITVAWLNRAGKVLTGDLAPDYEIASLEEIVDILERSASA